MSRPRVSFTNFASPQIKRKSGRPPAPITARELKFIKAYVQERNATKAAITAGYAVSKAPDTACRILKRRNVQQAIERELERQSNKIDVKSEDIFRYWYQLANADARELSPIGYGSCRHCHGIDFQYQFTLTEMRHALRKHTSEQLKRPASQRRAFDELGGPGYDRRKKPNVECPECNGQGVVYRRHIDLDKLSPGAILLFDGFKMHRDGAIEVKIRDRSRAMENLQTLMGLVRPRKPIEILDPANMTDEQLDVVVQGVIDQGLLAPPDIQGMLIDHAELELEESES